MKKSRALNVILLLSGILLVGIGFATTFMPIEFSARNEIDLGGNIGLLNDTRAAGAGLLGAGIIIMLGAFIRKLAFTSLVVSILIYLSYAFGRIVGIVADGMPVDGLVKATAVEVVLGLVGVFALIKFKEDE